MNLDVMFSSKTDDWATPQDFYNRLDEEFHFSLDPCASEVNHKCAKYYTIEDNGLAQSWRGERVFCNPPYGRDMWRWIRKCYDEATNGGAEVVVALIPARTDTAFFHRWIYGKAELRFVRGRLKFGGGLQSAPFPSMVVIWRGGAPYKEEE